MCVELRVGNGHLILGFSYASFVTYFIEKDFTKLSDLFLSYLRWYASSVSVSKRNLIT